MRAAGALVVGAGLLALTGCTGEDVTADRLQQSVTGVFGNLWSRHEALVGAGAVTPAAVQAQTSCDRGGPTVPDTGPGDDWVCAVSFLDTASRATRVVTLDVTAHSDGCWQADGPPAAVGPKELSTPGGPVRNPVSAFEGCFPTG